MASFPTEAAARALVERGEPGGAFLLAGARAFLALLIALFRVVPRLTTR